MIGAWVVAIATLSAGPANEVAQAQRVALTQVQNSLATMQRLAASAPRVKPGATIHEKAAYPPRKAELEAMMIYLGMVNEVMQLGRWNEGEEQNLLTVIHQTVSSAEGFDLLPEEVLCWERAGLNLAKAVERVVELKVDAGKFSPRSSLLAKAAVERFRKSYKAALARCVESID